MASNAEEPQIGKLAFVAEEKDVYSNILELSMDLEVRSKPNTDGAQDESRWVLRVVTGCQYKNIQSIETFTAYKAVLPQVKGSFNGGKNSGGILYEVNIKNGSGSADWRAAKLSLIHDSLTPCPEIGLPVVTHQMQFAVPSPWFDQNWTITGKYNDRKFSFDCDCGEFANNSGGINVFRGISIDMETRTKANSDGQAEESRYVGKVVLGSQHTGIKNLLDINDYDAGTEIITGSFPAGDVCSIEVDWKTDNCWTLIKENLSSIGNSGSQAVDHELTYVSASDWFDQDYKGE